MADDTIWLRGCDDTQAKMFIDQLADIGYDADLLDGDDTTTDGTD